MFIRPENISAKSIFYFLLKVIAIVAVGYILFIVATYFLFSWAFASATAWGSVIIAFAIAFFLIDKRITFILAIICVTLLFFTEDGFKYRKCMGSESAGFITCANQITIPEDHPLRQTGFHSVD